MLRLALAALALTAWAVPDVEAYCWQAGWNPAFNGTPTVVQTDPDLVTVSWKGKVVNAECADHYLVKYWPITSPAKYTQTEFLAPDVTRAKIKVVPGVEYMFQVIAREEKGLLGVDYNRSKEVRFRTTRYYEEAAAVDRAQAEEDATLTEEGDVGAEATDKHSGRREKSPPTIVVGSAIFAGVIFAVLAVAIVVAFVVKRIRKRQSV